MLCHLGHCMIVLSWVPLGFRSVYVGGQRSCQRLLLHLPQVARSPDSSLRDTAIPAAPAIVHLSWHLQGILMQQRLRAHDSFVFLLRQQKGLHALIDFLGQRLPPMQCFPWSAARTKNALSLCSCGHARLGAAELRANTSRHSASPWLSSKAHCRRWPAATPTDDVRKFLASGSRGKMPWSAGSLKLASMYNWSKNRAWIFTRAVLRMILSMFCSCRRQAGLRTTRTVANSKVAAARESPLRTEI